MRNVSGKLNAGSSACPGLRRFIASDDPIVLLPQAAGHRRGRLRPRDRHGVPDCNTRFGCRVASGRRWRDAHASAGVHCTRTDMYGAGCSDVVVTAAACRVIHDGGSRGGGVAHRAVATTPDVVPPGAGGGRRGAGVVDCGVRSRGADSATDGRSRIAGSEQRRGGFSQPHQPLMGRTQVVHRAAQPRMAYRSRLRRGLRIGPQEHRRCIAGSCNQSEARARCDGPASGDRVAGPLRAHHRDWDRYERRVRSQGRVA